MGWYRGFQCEFSRYDSSARCTDGDYNLKYYKVVLKNQIEARYNGQ